MMSAANSCEASAAPCPPRQGSHRRHSCSKLADLCIPCLVTAGFPAPGSELGVPAVVRAAAPGALPRASLTQVACAGPAGGELRSGPSEYSRLGRSLVNSTWSPLHEPLPAGAASPLRARRATSPLRRSAPGARGAASPLRERSRVATPRAARLPRSSRGAQPQVSAGPRTGQQVERDS